MAPEMHCAEGILQLQFNMYPALKNLLFVLGSNLDACD